MVFWGIRRLFLVGFIIGRERKTISVSIETVMCGFSLGTSLLIHSPFLKWASHPRINFQG